MFNTLILASVIILIESKVLASTLFYNGKIFTSQTIDNQLFVESVVINGNRIVDIGTTEAMLRKYDDDDDDITKMDLHQHIMMAGINDAHVHIQTPTMNAVYLNDESFVPAAGPTVQNIIDALRNASIEYAMNQDIIFYMFVGDIAFRDSIINNNKNPNPRQVLSTYAPNHGVMLYQWSQHCAFINDKIMEIVSIGSDYDETDICNGLHSNIFGDDFICNQTKQFIGIIEEYSFWSISRLISHKFMDTAQIMHSYKQYMTKANKMGITSVQNMPLSVSNKESNQALRKLEEQNKLTVRWRSIAFYTELNIKTFEELTQSMHGMNPHQLWNYFGVKYILDGSPVEENAFMKKAYKQKRNRDEWFGKLNVNILTEILNKEMEIHPNKKDNNNQLLIHIVGDKATEIFFESVFNSSAASAEEWKYKRLRIEHGDLIYDYLDTVRAYNMIIVQNPTHASIPDLIEDRWGEMHHLQPFQSVLNHTIHFAFGSDNQLINPWIDIYFALIHPTSKGNESVSLRNALIAYTSGSAYAEFMENEKGKIDTGYLADLIVLNHDIFDDNFKIESLFTTKSIFTMVDGAIVYKDEAYWNQLQSKTEL